MYLKNRSNKTVGVRLYGSYRKITLRPNRIWPGIKGTRKEIDYYKGMESRGIFLYGSLVRAVEDGKEEDPKTELKTENDEVSNDDIDIPEQGEGIPDPEGINEDAEVIEEMSEEEVLIEDVEDGDRGGEAEEDFGIESFFAVDDWGVMGEGTGEIEGEADIEEVEQEKKRLIDDIDLSPDAIYTYNFLTAKKSIAILEARGVPYDKNSSAADLKDMVINSNQE